MKSFNDIWENAGDAEVMLAMPGWLDCGTKIVNNAIIMALKPHALHRAIAATGSVLRRVSMYNT